MKRTFGIVIVVLFLFVTMIPGFAQGKLANVLCKTEQGNFVKLTTDTAQKYINNLNNDINNTLSEAVKNGTIDELKSFRLKKSIETLLDSVSTKGASKDKFNDVRKIVVSNWREHSPELTEVMRDVEKILAIKGDYSSAEGLSNEKLKIKLGNLVRKHKNLGYTGARKVMFADIDNVSGYVEDVYTGRKVKTNSIPDAGGSQSMNTEHTWPKSLGAKKEPAKADLYHLFPCDTRANSIRSSYPFGIVTNPSWSKGGSKFDGRTFMPRACHRGNVARAIFYFSIVYKHKVPPAEEKALKKWNKEDPVDVAERKRNEDICKYQGNRNPFIDRPDFIDKISDF